jgi:hypothetical protein
VSEVHCSIGAIFAGCLFPMWWVVFTRTQMIRLLFYFYPDLPCPNDAAASLYGFFTCDA